MVKKVNGVKKGKEFKKAKVAKDAGMRYFLVEQDGAPKPFENITTSYKNIQKMLK